MNDVRLNTEMHFKPSILFLVTLQILSNVAVSIAHADEQDFAGWYSVTAGGKLDDVAPELKGFRWFILDQTRLQDNSSRFSEHLLFVQGGYDLTEEISLWLGYTHNWSNPADRSAFDENRPYQDFLWKHPFDTGKLAARTRLEQRIGDPGGDLGWRFRQMFEYTMPLPSIGGLKMIVSDEGFFYAGTSAWGKSGFNENRAIFSLAYPVAKQLDLSLGYMNQFVLKSGAPNHMNHVLMVTFGIHP